MGRLKCLRQVFVSTTGVHRSCTAVRAVRSPQTSPVRALQLKRGQFQLQTSSRGFRSVTMAAVVDAPPTEDLSALEDQLAALQVPVRR